MKRPRKLTDYSDDDEDVQTDIAQLRVVCKRIEAHLSRKQP